MDSKNSYVGSILMFLNMFVLIVAMILLMIVGLIICYLRSLRDFLTELWCMTGAIKPL